MQHKEGHRRREDLGTEENVSAKAENQPRANVSGISSHTDDLLKGIDAGTFVAEYMQKGCQ
ncbi:hypothetical protein ACIQB5_48780 [Streptomyces sp. NPDC088560]|uniref:hypothetical protein n=1 Tax=Streptomyces sp. NPDC088560 TaxID=3365868 RepID=UPI00382B3DD1